MPEEIDDQMDDSNQELNLIDCDDDCPDGHIKVHVYDPNTGELLGCNCIPEGAG